MRQLERVLGKVKAYLLAGLFGKAKYVLVCVAGTLLLNPVQAETYYFHNDHLGTPQVVTDVDQQVVWKGEYDPFGKVTETVSEVEQNLRFPGQYYDEETGLHYNYFRTYDPGIGRYTQGDPIGLRGGINTYAYVEENPLMYTDPYGLAVCGGVCVGVGVGLGVTAIANWTRNYWNEPVSVISDVNDWTELTADESIYHRMGPGNENNRKFVSPDGRSEAVFNCSDNLVTDPANAGTYNFFGPRLLNGIPHAITDVVPYFIFGTSPSDMFNPQRFTTTYEHLTR